MLRKDIDERCYVLVNTEDDSTFVTINYYGESSANLTYKIRNSTYISVSYDNEDSSYLIDTSTSSKYMRIKEFDTVCKLYRYLKSLSPDVVLTGKITFDPYTFSVDGDSLNKAVLICNTAFEDKIGVTPATCKYHIRTQTIIPIQDIISIHVQQFPPFSKVFPILEINYLSQENNKFTKITFEYPVMLAAKIAEYNLINTLVEIRAKVLEEQTAKKEYQARIPNLVSHKYVIVPDDINKEVIIESQDGIFKVKMKNIHGVNIIPNTENLILELTFSPSGNSAYLGYKMRFDNEDDLRDTLQRLKYTIFYNDTVEDDDEYDDCDENY